MEKSKMIIGDLYCFSDLEPMKYIGNNFSGNGYWHQFETESYQGVWCELADSDLRLIKEITNA